MPEGRLTRNPNEEEPPDFTSEAYATVRAAIVQANGSTQEEAARELLESWTRDNDARKLQWAQQERERAEDLPHQNMEEQQAEPPQPQQEEIHRPLSPQPPQEHRRFFPQPLSMNDTAKLPADRKRKLNPMQPRKMVVPTRIPQPSAYAIKRLKNFEYIEL